MNRIFGLPEELRSGKSQGFKKRLKLIQSGKQFTDKEYNDFCSIRNFIQYHTYLTSLRSKGFN